MMVFRFFILEENAFVNSVFFSISLLLFQISLIEMLVSSKSSRGDSGESADETRVVWRRKEEVEVEVEFFSFFSFFFDAILSHSFFFFSPLPSFHLLRSTPPAREREREAVALVALSHLQRESTSSRAPKRE